MSIICKTENEVKQIIVEFQVDNPNLDDELTLKAVASCCEAQMKVMKK